MSVLLWLAALALAVHAASCPGGCQCRDSDPTALACSAPTSHLPADTASLSIRAEPHAPLALADLLATLRDAKLARLSTLDLADCAITSLDNVTFAGLAGLRTLDLSRNRINVLPAHASSTFNLSALRVLDLSRNQLHVVCGAPFRTLVGLRVLNLSRNAIESVAADGLRGPSGLQSLDLSANNLTTLPDGVFVPLVALQHLNLSGNRLRVLAPGTLQALPSLARLLLAGNPELGGGAHEAALLVGTGRRLQTVDASRTGLQHVPATLTHSVRTLRLAGNVIHAVRCGDLDTYPLLQLLDLTSNLLQDIEEDALGRLEMLSVLYLTDNRLRAIPRSLPDRLEILHLEANRIEQIVSGDLLGLPQLEVLLLNDNAITVVQEGAFSQVTALVTLDLSRNPITILPGGALAGPARLQVLRLSGLGVRPPAQDMAFPAPAPEHLVRLDLAGSAGLARQLLADTAALAAFRDLQELDLTRAGLTHVRSDLLHYLPQVHLLHLAGNHLNCSGLLWLALWMRRQDLPEYRAVTCEYPPELYGTLVVDLQDTDVQEVITSTIPTTTPTTTPITTTTTTTTTSTVASTTETEVTTQLELMELTEATTLDESMLNVSSPSPAEAAAVRSTVRGLQNTVKSSLASEAVTTTAGTSVSVTGAGHRSSAAPPDRLHLFPIAGSALGPATQRAPLTDGHIAQINPSDNRVATEPSNYKTNAPPPPLPRGTETLPAVAAAATAASHDSESQRRHAKQPDSFFRNDNVSGEVPGGEEGATVGTAGVMSKYSSGGGGATLHPGLLALVAAALGAGAALCTLVSHVRRQRGVRAAAGYNRHQDIEVNSLASVHELW